MVKRGEQNRIVLVTCAKRAEARQIARAVVGWHLAACVNIILSPVESFYTWKGKLEKAHEYLLVMKTTAKRLPELEREVRRLHSYDVPEFIALPITEGAPKYLFWLDESVREPRKKGKLRK
jgi:periplasmic divalent cation tolerance protein